MSSRNHRFLKDWTRDQKVLILGPVLLSLALVALFAAGILPLPWPGLLLAIVVLNVCGDLVYAVRNERRIRQGRDPLHNDVVGSRASAMESFGAGRNGYHGAVELAGAQWRAMSRHPVAAGAPVDVVKRRGLVLEVVPTRSDGARMRFD